MILDGAVVDDAQADPAEGRDVFDSTGIGATEEFLSQAYAQVRRRAGAGQSAFVLWTVRPRGCSSTVARARGTPGIVGGSTGDRKGGGRR